MPKPTFMQSVLRKPARSYADPYAPSPWSEAPAYASSDYNPPSSRYSSQVDNGVHLGYRDGYAEAGPSRRVEKKTQSVISDSQVSRGNRFPAPRKAASSMLLREEEPVRRDGTIKKKKKPRAKRDAESLISMEGATSPVSPGRTPTVRKTVTKSQLAPTSSTSSQRSLTPPPSLQPPSERGSSLDSSPAPLSPQASTSRFTTGPASATRPGLGVVQKAIGGHVEPPMTPPSSDWSELSTRNRQTQVPAISTSNLPPEPVKSPNRLSVTSLDYDSESENEVFYTPRSSVMLSQADQTQPAAQLSTHIAPPALHFQPPTPAPEPDPTDSPFHSEPQSSTSSLHPDNPITPRAKTTPTVTVKSPTPSPAPAREAPGFAQDDDAHSATGDVGSDDDEESERRIGDSRQNSFSRPRPVSVMGSRSPSGSDSGGRRSKPSSRPPSVVRSQAERPSSRASTSRHTSRNSFDDFVVRRNSIPVLEMPYSREGSIKSGTSGLGKGGWAAAAASRSGATTPVAMFMPTGANDGWADFQPPPRQSRFTPLPAASQPASFHTIVHGRTPNSSVPSSYSQESDSSEEDDDLPKASRSYARQDYASENGYSETRSQTSTQMDDRYLGSLRQRQASLGSSVDPYAVPRPASVTSAPAGPQRDASLLRQSFSQRRFSQNQPESYDSRPTSPIPSRPSSRMGFDPPSFLNPDTLTVLPEMSHEDSIRTYAPSEPARPPRRSPSMFGGRSRGARSEIDYEDERDEVPDLPKRAKSAIGHREDLSRWEGSSTGEGVLMESHGRGAENVTGYSTLILPNGAYRPVTSPTTTSSNLLDHRVLGMPHATMAAIVLSTLAPKDTPTHLRDLNPPVDFSSHIRPPHKISDSQILVQVYATAIDETDIRALDDKGRGDIGKWVPGRSFVGRCMSAGADEKEIVRGEIVIGIMEVRKSGALAEYIVCDRRRIARAPHPTHLSLEQLALLPLHGIAAARICRTLLVRHSRALIMNAHAGVPALVCQEMARAGVNVTAVIGGGEGVHEAQTACMQNGARGVLTGSPAGMMLALDEGGWDFVLDTHGGQRVYDAAKRLLKNDAKLVTLVDPSTISTTALPTHSRSSGLRTLKAAFGSRKKDEKRIDFEYMPPTGSGEPAVDSSGVDCRDVLEESCIASFSPVVTGVLPFEKGGEVFKNKGGGVVRIIN